MKDQDRFFPKKSSSEARFLNPLNTHLLLILLAIPPSAFSLEDLASFCADEASNLAAADGSQNNQGSCSQTPQGATPSFNKMVSAEITLPDNAGVVDASSDMLVQIKIRNMQTGFFSDAQKEYYARPQELNAQGVIQGHQHISIQEMNGNLDAREFVFFKGLNEAAERGFLETTVPANTLKAGKYRICTITGTFTHQPVVMPVAQRGSQDDCIRITVDDAGNNKKNAVANDEDVEEEAQEEEVNENNDEDVEEKGRVGKLGDQERNGKKVGSNKPKETQFITGACSVDDNCASTCCSGKKCRAVLSLSPGVEACGDGRTPNFDGPQLKIVQIDTDDRDKVEEDIDIDDFKESKGRGSKRGSNRGGGNRRGGKRPKRGGLGRKERRGGNLYTPLSGKVIARREI